MFKILKKDKLGFYIPLIVLFLLWPFGGLFIALLFLNIREYKYYVVSFFFLLGYSITFKIIDADSYAYGLQFSKLKDVSFFEFFGSTYLKGESTDLYKTLMYFLVSLFTSNPKVLFGFVGLVYGFLFVKCIELFSGNMKLKFTHYYLLLVFLFVIPYSSLNGFRFWTAAFYFVSAVYLFSKKRKIKFLFLAFSTVFIHFSFAMPSVFLIIYFFAGNRPILYFMFFVFTLFITNFSNILVDVGSSFLSNIFLTKLESYTISNYAQGVLSSRNNASASFKLLQNYKVWYIFIAVCITRLDLLKYKFSKELNNLFSILLLLFIFINLCGNIPSMGRFIPIITLLALYYIINVYNQNRTIFMRNIIYLSLPIVIISGFQGIELGLKIFSSEIVSGSFFSILSEKPF